VLIPGGFQKTILLVKKFIMKSRLFIIILLVFIGIRHLSSQSSFEIIYELEPNKSEYFFNVFEDDSGNYLALGGLMYDTSSYLVSSLIIKINSSGELIQEKIFHKQDTSYALFYGMQKQNGNYLMIGIMQPSPLTKSKIIYTCELTPNLERIWEKNNLIPDPNISFRPNDFLIDSNSIVIEGKCDTVTDGSLDDFLSFFRVNFNGEVIDSKIYNEWKDFGNSSAFIFNYDSTGYVLYGITAKNYSPIEWVEINKDFEITNYISTIDPQHTAHTPLSARWLPNGNILSGAMAGSNYNTYVRLMDSQLNTVQDTLLAYNETTYVITLNGMDYTDPDNIWLGTFYGLPTFFAGEEVFRIHIFNSEGHLKGMKVYGGEMRYWFYNLVSTSDGGCIITGEVPDTNGSWNTNGYIIKVMPDDILTNAEDTPLAYDRDVSVYPNPFDDYLNIETLRKDLRISLFDVNGQKILERDISNSIRSKLFTGNIKSGFYFYNITDNGRVIQSGKLLKR